MLAQQQKHTNMTGEEIKNKILLVIFKFYQITGEKNLKIQRSDFSGLSDSEIKSTLITLEKNEIISILDDRAVKNDISAIRYKTLNPFELVLEIKILDGFKKYMENNKLNVYPEIDSNEAIFRVTYKNRKLKINEILISKPNFTSENDVFAEFIINNPNKKITVNDFVNYKKEKMSKKFDSIIRDLGFYGNLKKLFFPNISLKAVEFKNPINISDMKMAGIDDIFLSDFQIKK